MRILLLIDKYTKGGAEKVYDLYTRYCISNGCSVVRMVMYGNNHNGLLGDVEYLIQDEHLSLGGKIIDQLKGISLLRKIIKTRGIDCIVSFLNRSNLMVIGSCFFLRKCPGITVTVHSPPTIEYLKLSNTIRYLFLPFLAWSYNRKRIKVIAVSKDVSNSLLSIGVKTVLLVHNPLELKNNNCSEVTIGKDDTFIIAVGRLEHEKAHWKLLKAFHFYKKTYQDRLLKLYILGAGSLEAPLKNMLNQELGDAVVFLGYKEQVLEYISKAQCMIFSSLYEGFSIALLECMSVRKPFIGSSASIPSEIKDVLSRKGIINTYQTEDPEINFDINSIHNDEKELAVLIHKIQTDRDYNNTIAALGYDWVRSHCSLSNFSAYLNIKENIE